VIVVDSSGEAMYMQARGLETRQGTGSGLGDGPIG